MLHKLPEINARGAISVIQTRSEYSGAVKEVRMEVLATDVEQVTGRRPGGFETWARHDGGVIASARPPRCAALEPLHGMNPPNGN